MKLVYKLLLCFAVVAVSLSPVTLAVQDAQQNASIRFCVPQDDIYPFYITESNTLTGINPDILKQIFNRDTLPTVTLEIVRMPWKRCNVDLAEGTVDMMIGGVGADPNFVVYPSQLGFSMVDSVVSTADVCFFTMSGDQKQRTLLGMQGKAPFVVGVEGHGRRRKVEGGRFEYRISNAECRILKEENFLNLKGGALNNESIWRYSKILKIRRMPFGML